MRRPSSTARLSSTPISDLPYLFASGTAHPLVWLFVVLRSNPIPGLSPAPPVHLPARPAHLACHAYPPGAIMLPVGISACAPRRPMLGTYQRAV
jgi:hypothetical protein